MQIIKVPGINSNGQSGGCEKAGNSIISELKNINYNENGKFVDVKMLDLEEIHLDNDNLELTNELIYKNSLEAFEIKPRLIFLGGDHSISFSITNAFLKYCEENNKIPCLIVFDSMPDLTPILNNNFPNNKGWLKGLVDSGFPAKNILLVGLRNSGINEVKFLKEKGIRSLSVNELLVDIENSCDTIMEFADGKELYLSIDISVVDPVFAPATNNKHPGGLSSRELLYIIQRMNKMKNLKAVDIVEINPLFDPEGLTISLGSKILSELL